MTDLRKLRVGLMALGLEAYWPQFAGLRERLEGYVEVVAGKLSSAERELIILGMIDTPQKALIAGHKCRRDDIDILLVYVTTYALSSTVLPVLLRAKVPLILLNLQPEAAIDYARVKAMSSRTEMTGEWLAYCSACPVPEIANVLQRLSIPFHQVTGVLHNDPGVWRSLDQWLTAAEIVSRLSSSRLGLMGHYYGGMLDIATDLVQVSGRFGIHIEMLEVDQLSGLRSDISANQIAAKREEFRDFFELGSDCSEAEQELAAVTSVALDRLVEEQSLDMLAYYYKGSGNAANEETVNSIILGTSMLTARGISVAGEYEVKNVIAMNILSLLGAGGSFTEYYAVDYQADVVFMGHDGPGHAGMAQDRIRVRPLQVYHGKPGSGLSVEMSVKHGPVTLLSVVEHREKGFQLLIAEGESIPGPILEIGNTNSRYCFSLGAAGFMERWNSFGPAHHCAVGLGHHAETLIKLAHLLQMPSIKVC